MITNGMRQREPLKAQMSNISKDLNHLSYLVNTNDIAHTDVDIEPLEARVNSLREQIREYRGTRHIL